MRIVCVLTTLAVLISVSPQYLPIPYGSGGIVFRGCTLPICWSGTLRGFKCHSGWCKTICTEVACFENKLSSSFSPPPPSSPPLNVATEKRFDVQVDKNRSPSSLEGAKTPDLKNPLQLYSRYENCTSNFCTQGDYSASECKNGFCPIVCKKENCYKFMIST